MQTFLPYPDFRASMNVLDYRRLGKQRIEARIILRTLLFGGGWENHPAVKLWRGYEDALATYYNETLHAWIGRGFQNTMVPILDIPEHENPPWLGDSLFHRTHRANLLRKDPVWYGRYWDEDTSLPYFWPVG